MQGTVDTTTDPHNQRFHRDETKRIAYTDPNTWTNATPHWLKMLDENSDKHRLRVCIAHYASRFQDHLGAKKRYDPNYNPIGDWNGDDDDPIPYHKRPDALPPVEYTLGGELKTSSWLAAVIEAIESGNKRVFMDLSHMTGLVYSEASRLGEKIDRSNPFGVKIDDGGRYALAFRDHLSKHAALHKHILYASDWHMPEISRIGPSYRRLIEGLLPSNAREDIMGRNAVRFFGLHEDANGKKSKTRQRLEEFYRHHNVLEDVRWMGRVDTRMGA